jgi:DNA-binding XRE family transcriptional regulator
MELVQRLTPDLHRRRMEAEMNKGGKERAELLAGAQTLDERLSKELKNPGFREAFEAHYLEALIAEKLHELREKKNLTQKQLAARVHMQQNAVSRIEKGENSLTLRTVQKMAAALGYQVVVDFKPVKRRLAVA